MIKPLQNWVLIEELESITKTKSGIIIPEIAVERPSKGTVIAVGPGKLSDPMVVKPGDIVFYPKHSVQQLKDDNKMYLMVREPDLFAIGE